MSEKAETERRRVPPPMVRKRIASGRGATEQPNATGDGDAALTPRFWLMVVLTGVATGLIGDLLMWVLFTVQHLAFDYHSGELQTAVEHASSGRRVAILANRGRTRSFRSRGDLDDELFGQGPQHST